MNNEIMYTTKETAEYLGVFLCQAEIKTRAYFPPPFFLIETDIISVERIKNDNGVPQTVSR